MTDLDLSKLTHKTTKVSRGYTYSYYTAPAQSSKPTVLLFHGWPDTAKVWAGLINDFLLPNGYGVVALDCLGYGGTSKPAAVEEYAWPHMTRDAVDILDAEGLDKVVSMGHDWGSCLCQRFYNHYPNRTSGLVMVNVTYFVPTGVFDLDVVNKVTREAFGAGIYEYWHFFTAEDATAIMNEKLESVYSVAFSEPKVWMDVWCQPGAMREFITEGRTVPVLPYATPEHKADFFERFSNKEDGGFAGPSCWYKSFPSGVQSEVDKHVPEENKVVNVPTLYWGSDKDYVCRPATLQPSIDGGYLPKIKAVTREGGHWALLENPGVFGQDILTWLNETY